jgi:hypothetical protein
MEIVNLIGLRVLVFLRLEDKSLYSVQQYLTDNVWTNRFQIWTVRNTQKGISLDQGSNYLLRRKGG